MIKIKNWKYKQTTFLILSFFFLFYLSQLGFLNKFVDTVGGLGYIGIVLVGIFFVSVFTVVPATVVLIILANQFNPWTVALLASAGAVVGDYAIFRFLKDEVFEELSPIFNKMFSQEFKNKFHSQKLTWLLPLVGAIIVASPFPDEVGLGLMGLGKIKTSQFILLTFTLNFLGILTLIFIGKSL